MAEMFRRRDLDPRLLEDPLAAQQPDIGLVNPNLIRGRFPADQGVPAWQRPNVGWAPGPPQDIRMGGMTPLNLAEKRLGPAVVSPDRGRGGGPSAPPGPLDEIFEPRTRTAFRQRQLGEEEQEARRRMLMQFLAARGGSRFVGGPRASGGYGAGGGGSRGGSGGGSSALMFRPRPVGGGLTSGQRAVYRARPDTRALVPVRRPSVGVRAVPPNPFRQR